MNQNSMMQRPMPTQVMSSPTFNNNNTGSVVMVCPSTTEPPSSTAAAQPTATLANMKEKTPMCLVNELARFNKVQHQYHLVDEAGPPHKKTFTVVLKLDTEEYTASGPSIKKAQHAAAAIALDKTALKQPPPKSQRKALGPITPTVELNALAMKRGEPAVYQVIEPQRPQYIPNLNFRGMYHQRYHYPKVPTYYVSLKVGSRQFYGEGRTAQAARHNAAEEALVVLRALPCPDNVKPITDIPIPKMNGESNDETEDEEGDDLKSPISLVFEIALKRGLNVIFEVTRESGPPHMRTFLTRCTVGDVTTDGEGNGKKISKKRAAEKMIEELRKLPTLPPVQQQRLKKKPMIKKKNRNLIKQDQKSDPQSSQGINPISRLIQIQQAKKEREPVYTVLDERGEPRQREFILQCSLGDLSTNGVGPNKKTAKRNAAESMLQRLGYSRPNIVPGQATNPEIDNMKMYQTQVPEKKYSELQQRMPGEKLDHEGKFGRQLVPGILLMPDATNLSDQNNMQGYNMANSGHHRSPANANAMDKRMQTIAIIARELLDTGMSPTAEAIRKASMKPIEHQPVGGYKQKILYLADIVDLNVQFTDFPKGAKMEHICLVSVGVSPPQVKHGAGRTMEAAHQNAALGALHCLAELELDRKDAGDGLYINSGQGPAPKLANVTDLGSNPKGPIPITAKDSH